MADKFHHEAIYRGADQVARLVEQRLTICGAGAFRRRRDTGPSAVSLDSEDLAVAVGAAIILQPCHAQAGEAMAIDQSLPRQELFDRQLRARYRSRLVEPRRNRLRVILQRGIEDGSLNPDADIEAALTMMTGSWYARSLASDRPLTRWPDRIAALVWRSLGGSPPAVIRRHRSESGRS